MAEKTRILTDDIEDNKTYFEIWTTILKWLLEKQTCLKPRGYVSWLIKGYFELICSSPIFINESAEVLHKVLI